MPVGYYYAKANDEGHLSHSAKLQTYYFGVLNAQKFAHCNPYELNPRQKWLSWKPFPLYFAEPPTA